MGSPTMKSANEASGAKTPLQVLQKAKHHPLAKPLKRHLAGETNGSGKTDRVKEYMEQKFYEQFMPKRDANSRIRKLSLDRHTVKRAQGHSKKRPLTAAKALAVSGKSLKRVSLPPARRPGKPRGSRLSSEDAAKICTMVLSEIGDL